MSDLRHKRKLNNRKGFTLAELLTVVAITVILAGIAIIGIMQYNKRLKIMEMNNTAKEIYIAAQNHLTAMDAAGQLDQDRDTYEYGSLLNDAKPGYLTGSQADAWKGYYGISKGDVVTSDSQAKVAKLILPFASIDPTVRGDGDTSNSNPGDYVIEYNPATATVYGVYYTDGSTRGIFGSKSANRISSESDIKALNRLLIDDESDALKDNHNYNGMIVGFYGGAMSADLDRGSLKALTVKIDNGDKLLVSVTDPNFGRKSDKGTAYESDVTIYVEGTKSGKVAVLYLSNLDNKYKAVNLTTSDDGESRTYELCLDDITSAKSHFANIFRWLQVQKTV